MKLEERVNALEDAHRILAAQHDALFQVCRVILPIAVSSNPSMVSRMLTSCYDLTSEHMDTRGMDDEYQADVRAAMDMLSKAILAGCTQQPRPS